MGTYGQDEEAMVRRRNAQIPLGQMGDAWDVANAAVFLASDRARFISGIELVIDGGMSATVRGG
jgi:NAD(P)-dependent dehydrogenase (short-subunit alcohol dehydrogenase family)